SIKASAGSVSDKCRIKVGAGSSAIALFKGTKTFDYTDKTVEVTARTGLSDPGFIVLDEVTSAKTSKDDAEPYFIQNLEDGTICFADLTDYNVIDSYGTAFGQELFDGAVHSYDVEVWNATSYTAQMTSSETVILDDVAYPVVSVDYKWRMDGSSFTETIKWAPSFAWYAGNEEVTLIGVE
ncbi:MAG: hypothetical protein IJT95_03920, partial [Abditibacteriota bacterium]|nr:hypothetical protein [Abditibacteriota bacterium]